MASGSCIGESFFFFLTIFAINRKQIINRELAIQN